MSLPELERQPRLLAFRHPRPWPAQPASGVQPRWHVSIGMQFSAETTSILAGAEVMSELGEQIGLRTATTSSRARIMKATL